MAQAHARIFNRLRGYVLDRLVEVRGSIDHAYSRIPENEIREQFDLVLSKMESFLATESPALYKSFASRYLVMRVGQGVSPENLIHSVVAIGDIVVQIARKSLQSPEREEFTLAVVRMNFTAARLLVELLSDDMVRRQWQLRQGGY